jgi:flagellar biosynthesis protein FlhB
MSSIGTITDEVLHDILLMGALAASIFVKNPVHQQVAGQLINAVNTVLQTVVPQLENTTN